MPGVYYNENDSAAAQWIRNLIADGLVPDGDVDERSIADVMPGDVAGYSQCHFFAGIAGWAYALRLAGWPDERSVWTGSCPCQPWSVAGRRKGNDDERHLWPHFFRLIRAVRPDVLMGEQTSGKAGYGWLDGVRADLEGEDYACRAVDIPACATDAPHIRSRIYWIAVNNLADAAASRERRRQLQRSRESRGADCERSSGQFAGSHGGGMADAYDRGRNRRPENAIRRKEQRTVDEWVDAGCGMVNPACIGRREGRPEPEFRRERSTASGTDASIDLGHTNDARLAIGQGERCDARPQRAPAQRADASQRNGTFWSGAEWIACHDGKARRAQPGAPLLVAGLSGELAVLRSGEIIPPEEAKGREDVRWISRTAAWKGFGNAINAELAAHVVRAFMDVTA